MEKLFIYDLETTGVHFWKNGIIQIAYRIVINGEIISRGDFKVKPNPKAIIEDKALAVSGTTREMIETFMEMSDVYKKIVAEIGKHVDKFKKTDKFHLVGFNNRGFDDPFFRAFFVQNAKTPKEVEFGNYFGSWFWSDSIDVMVMASNYLRGVRAELKDFKLATVAEYLGIKVDPEKLHDADYDLELTYNIFKIINSKK